MVLILEDLVIVQRLLEKRVLEGILGIVLGPEVAPADAPHRRGMDVHGILDVFARTQAKKPFKLV